MNATSTQVGSRIGFLVAMLVFSSGVNAAITNPNSPQLKMNISGQSLVFSFPSTSTNYYGLQTCSNFSGSWITIQSGIPGNGALQTLTLSPVPTTGQGFYRLVLQPQPAGLILPQGDAFAILGHSCGGIQEQMYATGFDPATGYPTGNVYLKTGCGGSGRGGGYHVTYYTAWAAVTWDFSGNVVSYAATTSATANPSVTFTDSFGDILYNNASGQAYLVVPFAAAPSIVSAVQSGDQFLVSWTPNDINPAAITSSILTATPVNSATASNLTSTVTGTATSGAIDLLQPATTYQITLVNNALSGASPASAPVTLTTKVASVLPSAPTNVVASWAVADPSGTTDTLIASWAAAVPGDSPVDQYMVTITPDSGSGASTNTVSGSTLTTYFGVDFTPNWKVIVKAHNAVGWGPASASVTLGGL
jgi:hypothetical protein